MKKLKIILTFFFVLALPVLGHAAPFNVRISLSDRSSTMVPPRHIKNPGVLVIWTKITNISNKPQRLKVMTCTYGNSWIPSSNEIFVGLETCPKNYGETVLLKPQEEYSRPLLVAVTSKARMGELSFQLGFDSNLISPHSRIGVRHEKLKGVVWSNHLRVRVRAKMMPYLLQVSNRTERRSKKEFEMLLHR